MAGLALPAALETSFSPLQQKTNTPVQLKYSNLGKTGLRPTSVDEAFTGTDKYLNGVCVFRKGRYIGGFADLKLGRDGIPESMKLSANIKQ